MKNDFGERFARAGYQISVNLTLSFLFALPEQSVEAHKSLVDVIIKIAESSSLLFLLNQTSKQTSKNNK